MRAVAALLLVATVLGGLGCRQIEVSPEEWGAMSREEKEMVVRAQLGAEAAADAKGGRARRYAGTPGEYVDRLDALYAAGESRTVQQIWPELAE